MVTDTITDKREKASYVIDYTQNFGSIQTVHTQSLADYTFLDLSRVSNRTPHYHDPNIRQERLVPLAFSFTKSFRIGWHGTTSQDTLSLKPTQYGYYKYRSSGPQNNGYAAIIPDFPSSQLNTLVTRASNSLLTKLKNQSINLAQVVGERRQAIRMFTDTVNRVAHVISHLKKGDIIGAANFLNIRVGRSRRRRYNRQFSVSPADAAANAWLELQYGWKPFFSDLYGACEQIAKKHSTVTFYTSSVRKRTVIPLESYQKTKSSGITTELAYTGTTMAEVRYSVTYVRPAGAPTLLKELGITNPLVLAWELLPFSFVVDWFLPIGNFLGTFDATVGLAFHSGYKTVFQQGESQSFLNQTGTSTSGITYNNAYTSSHTKVSCVRTPLTSFPTPMFPSFKNPLSLLHATNAVALLSQILRK